VRYLLSSVFFAIAVAIGCGGRTSGPETGTGSGGTASGAGGSTGTGGGTTVGGTTSGTGGGTTVGGTTSGTGGGTTVGGTTSGTGGGPGGTGGSGGSGGAGGAIDPGPELSACTGPGQCELVMAKCCACGILGLDQVAAINSAKRDVYSKQICGPNPLPCPPCVGTVDPNLMARCESGRCLGFDIRSDPTYTKCGSDQECFLRKGLACCECGAAQDWVAISRVGSMLLGAQVCGAASVCPTCVPVPPTGYSAVCRNGACTRLP
jgi:hypothetical protein